MNSDIFLPPQLTWATGALASGPLIRKTTRLADLPGIFADGEAWKCGNPQKSVYDVDVLGSPVGEGALFVGVTHLRAGNVGDEFFMTRGHFHQRREQGRSILACADVACCCCERRRATRGLSR